MQASLISEQEAPKCIICIENIANSQINGCEHLFCLRCIRKWAKKRNTCPLCRKEFLSIQSRSRHYKVTPPPPPPPRVRINMQNRIPQQRIIYIPIIMNPQPLCYFYDSNGNVIGNNWMNMQPNVEMLTTLSPFFSSQ